MKTVPHGYLFVQIRTNNNWVGGSIVEWKEMYHPKSFLFGSKNYGL